MHYASFTLADSIKREQENIRDVYVRYKMECDQLSKQINYLSQQIESSNGRQNMNTCNSIKQSIRNVRDFQN